MELSGELSLNQVIAWGVYLVSCLFILMGLMVKMFMTNNTKTITDLGSRLTNVEDCSRSSHDKHADHLKDFHAKAVK